MTRFFEALAARDAAAAGRLLASRDSGLAGAPLLRTAVLRSGDYTPPSAARVEHVDISGGRATVRASFALDGQRYPLDLALERDGHATAGLFHRWHIDGGVYGVGVTAPGLSSVLVAGSPTPLASDDESTNVAAFPGGYRVRLPDQPLWTAEPVVAVAGAGDARARAALQPTIKDSARSAVDARVRAYLEDCARSTVLSPPNCPFSAYAYEQVRNIRWKIVRYPEFEVSSDYAGRPVVSTATPGDAEVTGTAVPAYGGSYSYRVRDTFTVSGAVTLSGDQITFQPGLD